MEEKACCCAPGRKTKKQDCAICGKPLVYFSAEKPMECAICHKRKPANAACEAGHFVCDDCHSGGGAALLWEYIEDRFARDEPREA